MDRQLARAVLLETLSVLPDSTVALLKQRFSGDLDRYLYFTEALEEAQKHRTNSVREEWRIFSRGGGQFHALMQRYIRRYRERAKEQGQKGTLAELEHEVSNHSKWNRMMNDRGVGNQYRDDLRRVCFVFRLSYVEATELLWTAGQPFDASDRRDFVLARCLTQKRFSPEEVEQVLEEENLPALFRRD